jgi:hypothetical protein
MSGAAENLSAFSRWLRANKAVTVISGTGVLAAVEAVAKWVHFEGFTLSPAYLLPVLVGLIFLGAVLFCTWIATNPRLEPEKPAPRFSPTATKAGKLCVLPLLLAGAATVFFLLPVPRVPATELKSMFAAVDAQHNSFLNGQATYNIFLAYNEARKRDGADFWTDPDDWETRANVEQDNSSLRAAILPARFVSPELAGWQGSGRVRGLALEDVSSLVHFYTHADELRSQIEKFNPVTLADQHMFNDMICDYWNTVLKGYGEENRMRQWLKAPLRKEQEWVANR